jgi:hypothetical protein
MRSIFDARLVKGPFGDPGVYVDFRFESARGVIYTPACARRADGSAADTRRSP